MYRIKQLKIFRFLICVVRIPYIYLFLRGHIAKHGAFSVDAEGDFVPWLTYPFVDFINNLDLSDCRVFEFGAGSSSFWWSKKVREVCSVEMEKTWYDFLRERMPRNMELQLCPNGGLYPAAINAYEGSFDIVVIDGAERYKSAVSALGKLSGRGIVVLDNSDWYPNAARMIRENGFVQLDFYGFSPGNSFPSITSLFYKNDELLRSRLSVQQPVIGGNSIAGGVRDDG